MYLIDTNIISEARKKSTGNPGVHRFFKKATFEKNQLFISVVTIGELRRGVELIHHRGDQKQAALLEEWLLSLLSQYEHFILSIDETVAQLWGRLSVPNPQNTLDKQIAATALVYNLTVVSRNVRDFKSTGVRVLNPFED